MTPSWPSKLARESNGEAGFAGPGAALFVDASEGDRNPARGPRVPGGVRVEVVAAGPDGGDES